MEILTNIFTGIGIFAVILFIFWGAKQKLIQSKEIEEDVIDKLYRIAEMETTTGIDRLNRFKYLMEKEHERLGLEIDAIYVKRIEIQTKIAEVNQQISNFCIDN